MRSRRTFSARVKRYGRISIDCELDLPQMDRLNALKRIVVTSTCAGHPELAGPSAVGYQPSFAFRVVAVDKALASALAARVADAMRCGDTAATATGIGVCVTSGIPNTGRNLDQLHAWWDAAIGRLAGALSPHPIDDSPDNAAVTIQVSEGSVSVPR